MKIPKCALAIIFIVGLSFRLLYGFMNGLEPFGIYDAFYYDRTAKGILSGEGYHIGNLYAYTPPGYAYFLAFIYRLSNINYNFVLAIQVFLSSSYIILIYLIGNSIFNRETGIIAAFLTALYPQFIRYPTELLSETLFLFLFLLSIYLVIKGFLGGEKWLVFLGSITLGLASLTREISFYFSGLVVVWFLLNREGAAKPIPAGLLLILGLLLVIAPWSIRNYFYFRSIVPISTNVGINFYIGNNPKATGDFRWVLPAGVLWDKPSKGEIQGENEIFASKQALAKGFEFVQDNPARAAKLAWRKFKIFWSVPSHNIDFRKSILQSLMRAAWAAAYIFITVAAVIGFIINRKTWRRTFIFSSFILYATFIHVLTFANNRFQLIIIPFLIVFSSTAAFRANKELTEKLDFLRFLRVVA